MLIALFMRIDKLDGELTQVQRTAPETAYVEPSPATQPGPVAVPGYTDDNRLRQIIREELALALEDIRAIAGNADARPAQPLHSGPDYERRRDAVAQSVDYYVAAGQITEQEMARLQMDIAGLNPDDQRAMLNAIVRAMNNGQLDGQL